MCPTQLVVGKSLILVKLSTLISSISKCISNPLPCLLKFLEIHKQLITKAAFASAAIIHNLFSKELRDGRLADFSNFHSLISLKAINIKRLGIPVCSLPNY